jgi:hypothetical protein
MVDNSADQARDAGSNPFERLPRCGAKNRRGGTCGRIGNARNGRCHLHGGRSPGAPRGERNGRWRGGFHTPEARAERSRLRELIRQMRETMDELP